jgi:hypothetical protein
MAGDWIKMRGNLWDDPRVARLCDLTDQTEAVIIGGLYWLWSTADQHTETGILPGLTLRQIDRKTNIKGFGEAICAIGWLTDHPDGVSIVRFEEHNGASAKRRALTAKRVANHRKGNDEETPEDAKSNDDVTQPELLNEQDSVNSALAREREREREYISIPNGIESAAKRASRLPADWSPSADQIDFCRTSRPDLRWQDVADSFRDYWIAKPGKDGRKIDWDATWRRWVRNEKQNAKPFQTANDKRKAFADALTGRNREQPADIIDI